MNVRTALKIAFAQLRDATVPSHTLAAELLFMHALGRERAWLYAHPDDAISEEHARQFFALVARRAAGKPTQHLTGQQEFWGLEFEVSPDVLIPRPETEHLIEVALDRLALREHQLGRPRNSLGENLLIADVGTGSGCIAVALAKELPGAKIYATDISAAALAVACRNAARHGVADRIQFLECNLLKGISGSATHPTRSLPLLLNVVISNPPYVSRREMAVLPREIRDHEPALALVGGEKGHELYPQLIAQSAAHLKPGGLLILELGHDTLPAVRPLLGEAVWANFVLTNDLAGLPRVLSAQRSLAPRAPKKL